jgi:hypothetical protein
MYKEKRKFTQNTNAQPHKHARRKQAIKKTTQTKNEIFSKIQSSESISGAGELAERLIRGLKGLACPLPLH